MFVFCIAKEKTHGIIEYVKKNHNMIGARKEESLVLVKREKGVSPLRTRRCNVGVLFQNVTGNCWEDGMKMMITKSEDLPMMVLCDHE